LSSQLYKKAWFFVNSTLQKAEFLNLLSNFSQKNTARKPCFFIASCSLSPKAKQEDAMVFFDFIDGGGTERTRNPAAISATFNLMIKKRGVFGSNYD
jgi:hypothetical protein